MSAQGQEWTFASRVQEGMRRLRRCIGRDVLSRQRFQHATASSSRFLRCWSRISSRKEQVIGERCVGPSVLVGRRSDSYRAMAFCETSKMFRTGFNLFMWEVFVFGARVVPDTSSLDSVSKAAAVAPERERRLVRTTTRSCNAIPCFAGHRNWQRQHADKRHSL